MRDARSLSWLLALTACAAPIGEPTAEQSRATELALLTWELRFGFAPTCRESLPAVEWYVLPLLDAQAECECEARCEACHLVHYGGRERIVLSDRDDEHNMTGQIAHELVHALQYCGGHRSDPEHRERGVWPELERATLRAMGDAT